MTPNKYRVNDIVSMVCSPHLKLHIVTVNIEICPGGTQYHYLCRAHHGPGKGISSDLIRLNELELCEFDEAEHEASLEPWFHKKDTDEVKDA